MNFSEIKQQYIPIRGFVLTLTDQWCSSKRNPEDMFLCKGYSFIWEENGLRRSLKIPNGIRRTPPYTPHYIPGTDWMTPQRINETIKVRYLNSWGIYP